MSPCRHFGARSRTELAHAHATEQQSIGALEAAQAALRNLPLLFLPAQLRAQLFDDLRIGVQFLQRLGRRPSLAAALGGGPALRRGAPAEGGSARRRGLGDRRRRGLAPLEGVQAHQPLLQLRSLPLAHRGLALDLGPRRGPRPPLHLVAPRGACGDCPARGLALGTGLGARLLRLAPRGRALRLRRLQPLLQRPARLPPMLALPRRVPTHRVDAFDLCGRQRRTQYPVRFRLLGSDAQLRQHLTSGGQGCIVPSRILQVADALLPQPRLECLVLPLLRGDLAAEGPGRLLRLVRQHLHELPFVLGPLLGPPRARELLAQLAPLPLQSLAPGRHVSNPASCRFFPLCSSAQALPLGVASVGHTLETQVAVRDLLLGSPALTTEVLDVFLQRQQRAFGLPFFLGQHC
mmetsp:Transcript_39660/g.127109  ORF Transcript_39660/g.127109 Transcript_39660/m.127109 type:complete len:406 (-) Transcript_39660:237-1454(-)